MLGLTLIKYTVDLPIFNPEIEDPTAFKKQDSIPPAVANAAQDPQAPWCWTGDWNGES